MRRLLQQAEDSKRRRTEPQQAKVIWNANAGPQTEALNCDADELFYGGAAGGGKTDLLLGAALTQHIRSIIFRREFKQLDALRDRAAEIYEPIGKFSGKFERWRVIYQNVLRSIYFGAVQLPDDVKKYQGHAHDLKAFDEITHFTREQYRFLIGWRRSAIIGQRTRVICAGNPPTDAEGDWVIDYWAPWLDPRHPNPAKQGELRWFATIKGKDIEVESSKPFAIPGEADLIQPSSRTFIRAKVQDNPFYMASGYISVLQGLPEPLRSQMLLGDFSAGRQDDARQVIPTEWVLLAQGRWTETPPVAMDSLGVDVARGGKDKTVLSPKHGEWFGHQSVFAGTATPDGWTVLQEIINVIPVGIRPAIKIDVIGVGSTVYDLCMGSRLNAFAMDARHTSVERDTSGQLGFVNKRAEWWWKFREALDPLHGDDLALPPDRELMADLTAPRWKPTVRGIQIEEKEDIIERIGRSPDKGDSIVIAHAAATLLPRTVLL